MFCSLRILFHMIADIFHYRVPTGPGKSWNFGGPFSRPGKSWRTAKAMESPGK